MGRLLLTYWLAAAGALSSSDAPLAASTPSSAAAAAVSECSYFAFGLIAALFVRHGCLQLRNELFNAQRLRCTPLLCAFALARDY